MANRIQSAATEFGGASRLARLRDLDPQRMEKFMPINSPVTGEGRTSWRRDLPLGLPENFDYKNLRTRDDVFYLIKTLPNSHRGHAAKMVYDHLGIIGHRLAYCAIMQA